MASRITANKATRLRWKLVGASSRLILAVNSNRHPLHPVIIPSSKAKLQNTIFLSSISMLFLFYMFDNWYYQLFLRLLINLAHVFPPSGERRQKPPSVFVKSFVGIEDISHFEFHWAGGQDFTIYTIGSLKSLHVTNNWKAIKISLRIQTNIANQLTPLFYTKTY